MPSVMAIVSKAIFEKDAAGASIGSIWPTDQYVSQNKGLAALEDGGDLYLVTVRPGDELWLVGVLVDPISADGAWRANPNVRPIRSIDALKPKLKFASGTGITAKPGALGMSLQTPRVLTDADVLLLAGDALPPKKAPHSPSPGLVLKKKKAEAEAPKDLSPSSAPDALPELNETLAAIQKKQLGLALSCALAAWRRLKVPALGDLVNALGKEANRSLAPLEGQRAELQEAWLDLASKRRAVDVERLLARLKDGSMTQLRTRFEALGGFGPDPRLLGPMLATVSGYHSYEIGPCVTMALKLARDSGDPRARGAIERFATAFLTPTSGDSSSWKEFLEKNGRKVEKVLAALPEKLELPKAVEEQLQRCTAALRPLINRAEVPSEEALLAEVGDVAEPTAALLEKVLADPTDLQARLIYGDALQERGDPRGEFIALQCSDPTAAKEKQAKALIKDHAKGWIAPLDLCVRPDSIRFERGFLSACRVEFNTPTQRAKLADHPLWRTVKEIDCDDQDFLLGAQLVSLTRATLTPESLSTLATRSSPVPLEAVIGPLEMNYGVRMRRGLQAGPTSAWKDALSIGALKRLTSLELSGWAREESHRVPLTPEGLAWLLDSSLGKQLTELKLDFGRAVPPLAAWIDELARRPTGLSLRCTFTNGNTASGQTQIVVVAEARRVGDEVQLELSFNNEMVNLQYLSMAGQIERLLEGFPKPRAPRLVTRYVGSKKRTTAGYPAIAARLTEAFSTIEDRSS